MFFFNNCRGRDYLEIYGIADAFYDLRINGFQGNKATDFKIGEECIVAYCATMATMKDKQIRFTRFRLERKEIRPDERGDDERVFCGPALQSETLLKSDAARHEQYSIFFNKNGDFKQQSVLQHNMRLNQNEP